MADRHIFGKAPSALPGIVAGTRYSVQNLSERRLYLQASADAPVAADAAPSRADGGGVVLVTPAAGESLWVWGAGAGGLLTFGEA